MVVNNRRFVLEKATKDWDGSTKLTEGIQLTGIVYESKKIEKGREVKDDRTFFCQNYTAADDFADAVMHRLPLKNLDSRKLKCILYDEKTYLPFGALLKSPDFGGGSTSLDLGQLKWGHLGFFAERCGFKLLPPGKQIELYWLNDFNDLVSRERDKLMKKGEEVCLDFEIAGVPNIQTAYWIQNNVDFDQLILEFYNPDDPAGGWVHVSYNEKGSNRKQVLTYDGKKFDNGLPDMKWKDGKVAG